MVLPGKKNILTINIDYIPDLFLLETFSYLSFQDLFKISLVCKRFYKLSSITINEKAIENEKKELLNNIVEMIKTENGVYSGSYEEDRNIINTEIKKKRCILCGIRNRKVFFLPCRHLLYCEECR